MVGPRASGAGAASTGGRLMCTVSSWPFTAGNCALKPCVYGPCASKGGQSVDGGGGAWPAQKTETTESSAMRAALALGLRKHVPCHRLAAQQPGGDVAAVHKSQHSCAEEAGAVTPTNPWS